MPPCWSPCAGLLLQQHGWLTGALQLHGCLCGKWHSCSAAPCTCLDVTRMCSHVRTAAHSHAVQQCKFPACSCVLLCVLSLCLWAVTRAIERVLCAGEWYTGTPRVHWYPTLGHRRHLMICLLVPFPVYVPRGFATHPSHTVLCVWCLFPNMAGRAPMGHPWLLAAPDVCQSQSVLGGTAWPPYSGVR